MYYLLNLSCLSHVLMMYKYNIIIIDHEYYCLHRIDFHSPCKISLPIKNIIQCIDT